MTDDSKPKPVLPTPFGWKPSTLVQHWGGSRDEDEGMDEFAAQNQSSIPAQLSIEECQRQANVSMKGPADILDRFKAMAKAERYTQVEFLERLIDGYERSPLKD